MSKSKKESREFADRAEALTRQYEGLRPALLEFALRIEADLRRYDEERGERGWLNNSLASLTDCIGKNYADLRGLLNTGDYDQIQRECAVIAAYAMMAADRIRLLVPDDSEEAFLADDAAGQAFEEARQAKGSAFDVAYETTVDPEAAADVQRIHDEEAAARQGLTPEEYLSAEEKG